MIEAPSWQSAQGLEGVEPLVVVEAVERHGDVLEVLVVRPGQHPRENT